MTLKLSVDLQGQSFSFCWVILFSKFAFIFKVPPDKNSDYIEQSLSRFFCVDDSDSRSPTLPKARAVMVDMEPKVSVRVSVSVFLCGRF